MEKNAGREGGTEMTERIREICEEMKSGKSTCKDCEFTVCPALNSYADKILEILDMKEIRNEKAN